MKNNIGHAVNLIRDAHAALLVLNSDERMEVGDRLAREFRKAGLLQNQASSHDYTNECTISAGPLNLTIDADYGFGSVMTNKSYIADDNGDMPF